MLGFYRLCPAPLYPLHLKRIVTGGHAAMAIRGIDKMPVGVGLHGRLPLAFLLKMTV